MAGGSAADPIVFSYTPTIVSYSPVSLGSRDMAMPFSFVANQTYWFRFDLGAETIDYTAAVGVLNFDDSFADDNNFFTIYNSVLGDGSDLVTIANGSFPAGSQSMFFYTQLDSTTNEPVFGRGHMYFKATIGTSLACIVGNSANQGVAAFWDNTWWGYDDPVVGATDIDDITPQIEAGSGQTYPQTVDCGTSVTAKRGDIIHPTPGWVNCGSMVSATKAIVHRTVTSNDMIANYYRLNEHSTLNGTTVGFTREGEYPFQDNGGQTIAAGPTAWFRWIAPANGTYTFKLSNLTFDANAIFYIGYGNNYHPVISDMYNTYTAITATGTGDKTVSQFFYKGSITYIQVAGRTSGSSGTFSLTWPNGRPPWFPDAFAMGTTIPTIYPSTHQDQVVVDGGTSVVVLQIKLGTPDEVVGYTDVREGTVHYDPDDIVGYTDVTAMAVFRRVGVPDAVVGATLVRVMVTPDLSDNPSIDISFDMRAEMMLIVADDFDVEESAYDADDDGFTFMATPNPAPEGYTTARVVLPTVSVAMPEPIIYRGKPYLPAYVGVETPTATVKIGPNHIRAVDPKPVFDGSGVVNPPPPTPSRPPTTTRPGGWDGRWVVDDLPDPPSGGYYWLGDASSADGTGGYTGDRTRWNPNSSTPNAPAWRSFFPYKPSVRAFNAYLPNGNVVHHPKGVHFNSEFVEHMWMDLGGSRRQPFTWVIAAMIVGNPYPDYRHFILDAGRNPDYSLNHRLSTGEVAAGRKISEGLNHRSLMTFSRFGQTLQSSLSLSTNRRVVARVDTNPRPKMFFGTWNGDRSYTGAIGPSSRRLKLGKIANYPSYNHRYYVLGRSQGFIDQDKASHMLVFEMRYWRAALNVQELDDQYDQLSSTYQFNSYRQV